MGRTTWIRTGLCLLAVLALLCMGLALAESEALAPELSVKAEEVRRGEIFEVNVGAVEGADAYEVNLLDENGERRDWAYEYDAGVFYISTAEATPGAYTLEAVALDESKHEDIGERTSIAVQVLDDSGEAGGIYFNVKHRENPKQNNFIYVSAYAPGAEYVYIDWVGSEEFAADPGTPDGLNLKVWDEHGAQEFYAVATYSDGTVSRTESVTVNVDSLPAAGEVSITDMPTHLAEGEDFIASYNVAGTEGVASELRVKVFTTDTWDEVYNAVLDGTGTFTIPARQQGENGEMYATFEAGRLYEIYVILTPVDKVHYGQAWENRYFAVVPAAGDQVHLSIADADSAVELDRGQEVPVAISAPGATAVRLWDGEEWVNLRYWDEWEEWSQSGEIRFNWSFWDKRVVYAEACFAEDAEWVRSNSVIVKVNTSGRLETPLVALSPSVPRGDLLDVRVEAWDERTEWRYAVLRDADGNEIFWLDSVDDNPYLPTAQLEPGRYILNVGSGAVGLDDGIAMRWFKVTEPEDNISAEPVYWKFTKTEPLTYEEVSFSASAMVPDVAVAHTVVEVFNTEFGYGCGRWESGECGTNDCVVGRFSADRAGSYEFVCYLYREGEEEPFEVSRFTLNVTADGTLDPVQIQNMPKQIAPLEGVTGTIVPVEGAEWYSFSFGINRDGEWEWFENHDQKANNTTIDYDSHWFDEVGLYCLSVGAHARGKNNSYTDAYLVVQPDPEGTEAVVTLSVDGKTETLENYIAQTQLPLVVTAPGGADVQYFDGNGWQGIDHLNNEIGYSGSVSFNGGDTTVLARAWFDELGGWRYSKPVTVHAKTTGEVGVLHLTLAPNEVARGDVLEVSFDAADKATEYNMHVRSVNGDFDTYIGSFEPDTHKLPTAMLEPGDYYVTVDYRGPGCDWRSVEQEFTVTAGIEPTSIIASLSANEIACSKRVILSVYAPGAEKIRIYDENNPNPDEWYDERDGDTFIRDLNWDHPETLHFTASAFSNGVWSERVEVGELRVSSDEQLARPEIKLDSSLIEAGTDVVFSFARVDNATQYWYELRDNDIQNGNDQIMDGWCYEPAIVKLPASLFRAGHTYRIEVHVGAPGYETNDARYSLAVRPYWDGDINLYVNGETESVEGWAFDGFHVVVDAPENARAIIVSDGMDWHWQPDNHFEDDFGYDFNGEVTLIARYTVNEIDPEAEWWREVDWAGYSNPVTLTIKSNGNMPEVEANVPESVTRGEWLEISVDNAETFLNEEAGYENLRLHAEAYYPSEDPDEDHWYGCFDWDGEGTILLPTVELEAGKTYELHVRADADHWVGSTKVYEFRVSEPENDDPIFFIDKTEVLAHEDFRVFVYAPGAVEGRMLENGWEADKWNGSSYSGNYGRGTEEIIHFQAEVKYTADGEWVPCNEIVVKVNAPDGNIPAEQLNVQMSDSLKEGDALRITWENNRNYRVAVEVRPFGNDDRVWSSWYEDGETEAIVPVEMPEWCEGMDHLLEPGTPILEAGKLYRVYVVFSRIGSNGLCVEKQILVAGENIAAEDIALRVNGNTEEVTIPVYEDVNVSVTAPEEATAILVWNGYDWEFFENREVEFWRSWGDVGERLLTAKYTTDTIEEGKEWQEYSWIGVSNNVRVRVTSNGSMPMVEATVPESVTRGDWLKIEINNVNAFLNEEADYSNLRLCAEACDTQREEWFCQKDWDGKGMILLPTAELAEGTYELHVCAEADGWVRSDREYEFTVDEPENGDIVFSIDKTEVVTGEDFTISVYARGADQVKLFERGGEIDCRDGAVYAQMHSHGEATKLRFHAEAHIPENDEWVRTDTIIVNVTAPDGSISADALGLTMPTQLKADQALTIAWNDLGLQNYDVTIERERDGVRVWHSWNNHGETETTIPVVIPQEYEGMETELAPGTPVLEAGEFYRVNLDFQRYGWNSLHIEKQIVVVSDDMFAEGLTLMADGQIDTFTTLVNVDVPVKITAPQKATAILLWNGYDWEMYTGNELVTTWSWGDANERLLYARYTTDTIAEGKDWREYGWSRVSNIVTVNVNKQGDVKAPEVELSNDAPLRGEKLSFTVANAGNGYDWTVYDTVDNWEWDWAEWNGNSTQEIDTYDLNGNRTYLLYVYKYGDVGYEGTLVEIPFTVTATGVAVMPEVEVDASIAQGDVLTIRIKNPEAGNKFRAWFWQEESGTNFTSNWNGVDTIYLPSFNLTPGVYTELYIQNDGLTGQERSCTVLPIEVTEPNGDLSLCVEKTDLVTQEGTYIVAYAPGAENIRVYAYNEGDEEHPFWGETRDGGVWQDGMNFTGEAGTKYLTAVANYGDGSTQTKTMKVTVTAPKGDLPKPVIDAPDTVEPGAELNFSVTAKDAEWWFVEVFDHADEEGQPMYHWEVENYEESRSFTVPADALVEGHTYGVNVYAARYAWNSASAYMEFTVGVPDDPYAENVLRLPAVLREIEEEAFEGISARTVVIPDGATTIGSRAFANCGNLRYVEIPDSVTSIADDAFAGSDVTFICNTGSPAYAYAQKYSIPVL